MNTSDVKNSQETLFKMTKVVETSCAQDASRLLTDGFVLLGIENSFFDDNENRFVYSLGFPKPIEELSQWASSNFK